METSKGSFEYTDFGVNVATQVTDRFRIGAQLYDHNLGSLGQYHPTLDWAVADYRFTRWFGLRGGKVKTVIGLHNDTQDLDFLRTFALLPQSVYPIDQRDITLAHEGGDAYGDISLGKRYGSLAYTVYGGYRDDSRYSGFVYIQQAFGVNDKSISGPQFGFDMRWTTPIKGLLVGASRLDQDITTRGTVNTTYGAMPFSFYTKARWTNQFYGEYTKDKLQLDYEYRRYYTDGASGTSRSQTDVRSWYVSGAYQVMKKLSVGAYYSHLWLNTPIANSTQSATTAHSYDKVVAARYDINRYFNV
jgi:hypothetical protein